MRLTKSEEGIVFKLSVDDNMPERARKYVPENLLRLSGECYVRILGVKNKVATLGLYETRADAEADKRCVELVAPPVTAATVSHLGVKYVDGQGWVEVAAGNITRELSDSLSDEESAGGSEGESVGEEDERPERETAGREAGGRRAEQPRLLGAHERSEGQQLFTATQWASDGVAEISELTGIRDEDALGRLAVHGLARAADLQLLKEQGVDFAQALAVAAGLSLCDAQRLKVYAESGGDARGGLGQIGSEETAEDGLGQVYVASAKKGGLSRPHRRAAAAAKKRVSFLEALTAAEDDGAESSEAEQAIGTGNVTPLRVTPLRVRNRAGGENGFGSERLESGVGAAQYAETMLGACAARRTSAGAVSCSSERAAPRGRGGFGGRGFGGRPGASNAANSGAAVRTEAGGGEAACLMSGVPKDRWESLSRECLEWLAPALLQRAPRDVEMRRPLKQLELWIRAAAAKGATVAVAQPGDEELVLDAMQELCSQLELRETRPPQGEFVPHQRGGAEGGAAYPAMVMSAAAGTVSAERLDDERAMMEAVMFVSKEGGLGDRLSEVARKEPGDPSIMGAAAALGGLDKLRPILYMGAGSIQMPSGMLATQSIMLLISDSKRLRALVLGQLAEHVRGLLPSAGTKAETASNVAEAVWTGALVSKLKLQEMFQPKGGSLLLAGGSKKATEQSPTELFARGLNLLSVVYQIAHGSFDHTIPETFGKLFSAFLDATQKRIEPARAAAFVVEPVLHEMERRWRRSTLGLQGERPIIGEVAAELRPQMLQTLSVEVAMAAAAGGETASGKGKEGGGKGDKKEASMDALQKKMEKLERSVGKTGAERSSKAAAEGAKHTRKSWRAKLEAWESENPGKCWYVENQSGGCTEGRKCRNWYEGHPEPKAA